MKKLILITIISHLFPMVLHAQDEFEMKEGDTTYIMKKYYMVLLLSNPDKEQLDSTQVVEIQKAHLDSIN